MLLSHNNDKPLLLTRRAEGIEGRKGCQMYKHMRQAIDQTCSPWQEGWRGNAVGKNELLVEFPWQGWYQDRYHPQTDSHVKKEKTKDRSSMERPRWLKEEVRKEVWNAMHPTLKYSKGYELCSIGKTKTAHLKIVTNFMSPCSCFTWKTEAKSSDRPLLGRHGAMVTGKGPVLPWLLSKWSAFRFLTLWSFAFFSGVCRENSIS